MKGLLRLTVLGAGAALFAWFFLSLGPDRTATHQPRSSGTADKSAEPPRANREQCVAELSRRNLTCDPAYWTDFWTRRTRAGAVRDL